MFETSGIAGTLALLLLEGFKFVWRKFVLKDLGYEFPPAFYGVGVPVLSAVLIPLLAFVGFEGFVMPTDWLEFARYVFMVLIASLVEFAGYTVALSPYRAYKARYSAKK